MKKTKSKNHDTFQFISERPKDGELLFGHKEIVTTLEKIVEKSPQSFTIGLFGNWGSGKSSIAETLQSKLKSKNIPLIIFDVWKHEGDALRRTFLKDLNKKLSSNYYGKDYYQEGFELEKNLENELTEETKDGYKFKGKKFLKNILVILLFIIIPLILILTGLLGIGKLLKIQEFSFDSLIEKLLQIIGGLTIPAIFWLKFSNSFIIEKKEVIRKSRIQDPIQFENSFNNILDNLTKKVEKIVVVFDNLDRVSGEKAVEIISTIKTFLEPIDRKNTRDIVFIVPCDSIAIKRHLNSAFKIDDELYADEFLRKFFNTIIWIPEFYDTELQKLAYDKLKETQISDFDNLDLAALIILVFDQNPRQIIQFINILLANYLLLKERDISGFSLKDNITQLAKYLLLTQRFPNIMDIYKKTNTYRLKDEIKSVLKKEEIETFKNELDKFIEFVDSTSPWEIESLDLFFKFRLTDFERKFENSTKLIKILESNRVANILDESNEKNFEDKKYLDELSFKDKTIELSNITKQKVKANIYPLTSINFINGLLELTRFYEIELNDDAYREIFKKIKKYPFNDSIFILDIQNIFSEILEKVRDTKLKKSFLKVLKENWVNNLIKFSNIKDKENTSQQDKFITDIFEILFDEKKIVLFDTNQLSLVNKLISSHYSQDLIKTSRISKSKVLREKYGSSELISKIIANQSKTFTNDLDINKFNDDILILNSFNNSLFNDEIYNSSVQFLFTSLNKITEDYNSLVDEDNNEKKQDYKKTLTNLYKYFERIIKNVNIHANNKAQYISLYNLIKTSFTKLNYKNADLYLKFFYLFETNLKEVISKNDAANIILPYLRSNLSAVRIKSDIKSTIGIKKLFENDKYLNVIFQKSQNQQGFIEQFYEYFDETKRQQLIELWIPLNGNKDINVFEEILKNLKYKIPDSDEAANKMLTNARRTNLIIEKEKFYNIIFKLNLSKAYDYVPYSNQVITMLCSTNLDHHKIGLEQIKTQSEYVVKFELKKKCEVVLKQVFLLNVNQYNIQIKNILENKFGISRKEINDFIKEKENIKKLIIDYLVISQSLDFLNVLNGFLYKSNFVDVSKGLITAMALNIKSNKNLLNVYRNTIDKLCTANLKDVEREFLDLLVSYSTNLSYNQFDDLMIKIEGRLYKNKNKLPNDNLRKVWLDSKRFGKTS